MSKLDPRSTVRSGGAAAFAWATGQDDNIGDSLLRRPYLDWLRSRGELNVWVRDASESFLPGLGLQPEDRMTRSFLRWIGAASASALTRQTFVALNAGEMTVSKRGAAKMLALAPVLLLCRMRGGTGVWIGSGVPPHGARVLASTYRMAARLCDPVTWRDQVSADEMGVGSVAPDWAFTLGTPPSDWPTHDQRDLLTIVLRGDRPFPDQQWWTWVMNLSERLSLAPTVVVQVRRDKEHAARAAAEHGVQIIDWPESNDHRQQEHTAREAYRRSAVTIGDRLHGLIVAATEGSIPLGWVPSSRGKISRHFDAVGIAFTGQHEGCAPEEYPLITSSALRDYLKTLAAAPALAKSRPADQPVDVVMPAS